MASAAPSRVRMVSVAVAVLLALVLLYFSLRGIDWREVARIVRGASLPRLAGVTCISTLALLLRACRWRILLNAEGRVSVPTTFWATTAGYFGNSFLPARAGELVRTFMISTRSGLDASYVLATALSERVADVVALVSISAVILLRMPSPPGWLSDAVRPFAVLAALGAAGIAMLPLLGPQLTRIIGKLPVPPALRPRLSGVIENVLRGMRAFHDVRRLGGFVLLTAIIWTLDAVGTVVAASALGLEMPLAVAFLLIAGLGLARALPSTPGYVGIFQFVAVSVLTPFGFSQADAIAYILVAQALSYVVIGVWGSLGILQYRRARRSA